MKSQERNFNNPEAQALSMAKPLVELVAEGALQAVLRASSAMRHDDMTTRRCEKGKKKN